VELEEPSVKGDQPAVIKADGTMEWYKDNKRHRDNDLPAVIKADGTREWWVNGLRNRGSV
jgi:hypothetical protein